MAFCDMTGERMTFRTIQINYHSMLLRTLIHYNIKHVFQYVKRYVIILHSCRH